MSGPRLRQLLWYVAALITGGGYLAWLLVGRYLPAANGRIGPDYSYFLPHLLDGQYFGGENRLGAVRWFTPAFCGGMPTWADPQDPFVTLAQWLTFWVTPLHAVQVTVIVVALAGAVGAYLFARRRLSVSRPAATVCGALVLVNGFYLDRIIVGHFGFHSFMLVPCVAFLVSGERGRWSVARMVGAAVLLAYMLHADLLTIFPVAMCAIVLLLTLCHGLAPAGQSGTPPVSPPRAIWQRLAIALVLALGISAAKIVSVAAFLSNVWERDLALYAPNIGVTVGTALRGLFIGASHAQAKAFSAAVGWPIETHELEYGITPVPVLLLVLFVLERLWLRRTRPSPASPRAFTMWTIVWAILIIAPLFATTVPFGVGSNSFRWIAAYIPFLAVVTGVIVDRSVLFRRAPRLGAAAAVCGILLYTRLFDRSQYESQPYDPSRIESAAVAHRAGKAAPAIDRIGTDWNAAGELAGTLGTDDMMVDGASALLCYQPVFGHNLQRFHWQTLRIGPVLAARDGRLNLKNPACYVHDAENHCAPGDHFRVEEAAAAKAFVHRQPWPFTQGFVQRAANGVSLVACALSLLALAGGALSLVLQRIRELSR